MIDSKEVLKRKELKKFKFCNEKILVNRGINITNHCRTHQCSDYCLRKKPYKVKYDEEKHSNVSEFEIHVDDKNEKWVFEKKDECRMGFGTVLEYDGSGENNRTRGKPPNEKGKISFDKNGIPKFEARRNHPRVLQEPFNFYWWGCNNDTQKLFANNVKNKVLIMKNIYHV